MFPCLVALLALVGLLSGWLVDPRLCVGATFFLRLRFGAPLSTSLTALFLLRSLEVVVQGPRFPATWDDPSFRAPPPSLRVSGSFPFVCLLRACCPPCQGLGDMGLPSDFLCPHTLLPDFLC